MRVTFLLTDAYDHPIGGYKVAYEYANRLAARGHEVRVCHVEGLGQPLGRVRQAFSWRRAVGQAYRPEWFDLSAPVHSTRWNRWDRAATEDADVVVATAWQTAEALGRDPRGRYLIQHYEVWAGSKRRVDATWRLPMPKIVIAGWLAAKAEDLGGGTANLVPNAIDRRIFDVDIAPGDRSPHGVAMLWHRAPFKGSRDGQAALHLVHEADPDLEVTFFSTSEAPSGLPGWIRFVHNADQVALRRIYNECAIFLSPSHAEGWPLPPAEAMACGAALVSTDIGGVADYAVDGWTARLAPVGDTQALAKAIIGLLEDRDERIRLATAGADLIHTDFNWERSTDLLEKVLAS
jgi:glycosyltransferase involved in cell wall biosynthesis